MAPSAPHPAALVLAIAGIAACGLIGGYGAMVTGALNGFFEAINASATHPDRSLRYIPGGPEPFKTRYTGIAALDEHLLVLVGFFASAVDGRQTWDITLSYWLLMLQCVAAWMLLVVEGFRAGNRGRAVSWTGTMGMIFQNISYTITVPIYLIIHLLTSPLASRPQPSDVLAPLKQTKLAPLCAFLAFVAPAIAMSLPSPSVVSPAAHYTFIAIWQIFPMLQTIFQWAFAAGSKRTSAHPSAGLAVASWTYSVTIALCVVVQVALILVAVIPASAVPPSWVPIFAEVDLRSAFVPAPIFSPPTVDPMADPIPDALAPLARHLLQYDIYGGNTAIFIWSLYVTYASGMPIVSPQNLVKLLVVFGTGGPIAAAALLLWKRDEHVAQSGRLKKEGKMQ